MYEISDKTRTVRNQDGGAVLDLLHGKVFHLNRTAALIWGRLQEHKLPNQIISEMSSVFGISEKSAAADLGEFLAGLEKEGLLVRIHSRENSLL